MNPILRSKTFNEIKLNKGMAGPKSKGLSIRSNSDMNISHITHSVGAKKNMCDKKEQDCMKLKVTQLDNRGCPISPGRKTPGKVIKLVLFLKHTKNIFIIYILIEIQHIFLQTYQINLIFIITMLFVMLLLLRRS